MPPMKAPRPERPARLPDYSEDCLRALVKSGLTTPGECWNLWRKREELAGSDANRRRARLAIATHLGRIVQHRRLEDIADPEARAQARQVRAWFTDIFLSEEDERDDLA